MFARSGISLAMGLDQQSEGRRASLGLQFAGATALDSRVTFTRASTATYTGSDGLLKTAAVNEARLVYDPATLAAQGLMVEEQRTNTTRNNMMVGAVAGTPGTLPTNWTIFANAGLTTSVVSVGTSAGISYVDLRFSGISNATFYVSVFDGVPAAASSGQVWTESFWCALVAGSTANINSINTSIRQGGGAGFAADTPFTPTATLTRFFSTGTLITGATGVYPGLFLSMASGVAIDITLRIGMPQLELGAFATSVIPTTTAQATRAADVATMTGTNFSSWYNASAGTMVVEASVSSAAAYSGYLYCIGSNFDNAILFYRQADSQPVVRVRSGGVDQFGAFGFGAIWTTSAFVNKNALAFTTNSFNSANNTVLAGDDTSGTLPTVTSMSIGSLASTSFFNGTIKSITYYPRRLANTELQALTS